MKKIKISAVSYLNTLPFIYGIEQNLELLGQVELTKDIPSECARKLIEGEVDLGLVPVAIIPELDQSYIISDYCIGAEGKVKSVLLLSDVPIHQIESIYLDYHSRTSVKLCEILCKKFWEVNPKFISAEKGFEEKIQGKTAGVIIGDRTFHLNKEYAYQYDLAEEWQKMTGLPFVFAAWVSNKKLPKEFIEAFNSALIHGVSNIKKAIEIQENLPIPKKVLTNYLSQNISYKFDKQKMKALILFQNYLKTAKPR